MKVIFSEQAWEEYLYWQKIDKKLLCRINELIKAIMREPFTGIGKPEYVSGYIAALLASKGTGAHVEMVLVELAGTTAHELNQPLMALSSYASAARELAQQPQQQTLLHSTLDKIAEQAQRAAGRERLVIASVASLRGRLSKYSANTLLVLDEAHHAGGAGIGTVKVPFHAARCFGFPGNSFLMDGKKDGANA